ncbi:MAG: methyltransferase domain-containing protein [Alphaproteobacteria bacterium]|nr:methyltransferase domain-containing protein [Alphaproteobacteria bacterium]
MQHTAPQHSRRFSGATADDNMLKSQVMTNRVLSAAVLSALKQVPREAFALPGWESRAYCDSAVPTAPGRFLPQPLVFARLLQEADIRPGEKVLDVACGRGYTTQVLALLARRVIGIDDAAMPLAWAPGQADGCQAPRFEKTPLSRGFVDEAPYDVIHINGMIEALPPFIPAQLAEGGRVAFVKAIRGGLGEITIVTKVRGALSFRPVAEGTLPRLSWGGENVAFRF